MLEATEDFIWEPLTLRDSQKIKNQLVVVIDLWTLKQNYIIDNAHLNFILRNLQNLWKSLPLTKK